VSINTDNYANLRESLPNLNLESEMEAIKLEFLKVIINMDEAYRKLTQVNAQKSRLELLLLQEQFNPHLLYNSLAVLSVYAQKRDDHITLDILQALSNYYRSVLTDDSDIISLDAELSIVSRYLEVSNLISLCRFSLDIQKDEDAGGCFVLKHMLQLLVENAIKHAYVGREEGVIKIICHITGEHMIIEVIDGGEGMSAETVAGILSRRRKSGNRMKTGGYGLVNLARRLILYCGDT